MGFGDEGGESSFMADRMAEGVACRKGQRIESSAVPMSEMCCFESWLDFLVLVPSRVMAKTFRLGWHGHSVSGSTPTVFQ
ncbi:MAG TPA: hypothetical protein DCR78_09355 [Pseudomonas sp.]|nr:hypothetical protein [Pseudomonas sp.]HAW26029.1 hypothetical protein [Pseudomonas sp.]HCC60400.1 hypothetical protein [Pseudomonas sp.]